MATARPRRVDYSESTRKALVNGAVVLFTERGYAGTSLDEVCKRARVTKGALYHHFSGKQGLFEAAFDAVEQDMLARLSEIVSQPGDVWQTSLEGLRAYLQVCLEPAYQRIVLHEGPVVMGYEQWKRAEERFSYGLVRTAVSGLMDSGLIGELPEEPMARLLFGALAGGATMIAAAEDQKKASEEIGRCIESVVTGLRALKETGWTDCPVATGQ
ncbi:TetR/AcrR family transcriptional regulator [Allokutzneria sp. A3M-2-11 16]|uniref:TetR/AcrR family transcriptional regulator n=1 Tax=Allokutzneria sp. A3M-2-11 16 TaxID=2962043 RepID=UPI0020B89639|nr:TetR/AcrR family transcriptional regulator [Allokutzneria sp. A3M-2-11 16]MCP3801826.1 TetR/AcrR family transcriptional regulator [Allokutzneria sp. A3M-2-11 16]